MHACAHTLTTTKISFCYVSITAACHIGIASESTHLLIIILELFHIVCHRISVVPFLNVRNLVIHFRTKYLFQYSRTRIIRQ